MISWKDFENVEIHVGKIIKVENFPEAKVPAYKLKIDFGKLGIKKSSARITKKYTKEELIGKLIVAVTNFHPKQIANFMSEVLVLGVGTGEGIVLLNVDKEVELGGRIC